MDVDTTPQKRSQDDEFDLPIHPTKRQKIEYPPTPALSPASSTKDTRPLIYHCSFEPCEAVFSRPCRLAEHERKHTGEKPFTCPHCPKAYNRDYHLSRHLQLSHTDSRDYACSYEGCAKAFATRQRRDVHENTHVNKKQIDCTWEGCTATFRKKPVMAAHIKEVHLGLKPFVCEELNPATNEPCGAGYQTNFKLQQHIKTIHSDIPRFYCAMCTKPAADGVSMELLAFVSYKEMLEHKRSHHIAAATPAQRGRPLKSPQEKPLPKPRRKHNQHSAKSASNDTANRLTGIPTASSEISCLKSYCAATFADEESCATHCADVHGMAEVEIAEALKERGAKEGGVFWFSKEEDDDHLDAGDETWFNNMMSKLNTHNEIAIDPELES
jgi:hypothetical protein